MKKFTAVFFSALVIFTLAAFAQTSADVSSDSEVLTMCM